jgi:FtsP/CotA-like multicopper oxidase with cupredoxin domain
MNSSKHSRINDRELDLNRIDELVPAGATEIWQIRNAGGTPHNFHVPSVSYTVLDYGGEEPPPHLSGLNDTIYAPPDETVGLLVRFPDYPDPDSPYMLHCHPLRHEDRGLMGRFVLVTRGQKGDR